jgi:exonuclease 1
MKLVRYCTDRINMLKKAGVTPIIVFDGGKLKIKENVEKTRNRNREENKQKAQEAAQQGNNQEAIRLFGMSIDITPKMAHTLIMCLIEHKVEYVVAPYEADAQLAYLFKSGQADVVFTEDSDLLAFGCTHVLFKMDNLGNGQYINLEQLTSIKIFENYQDDMLLTASILSGCDYLESVKGIGFKKA